MKELNDSLAIKSHGCAFSGW